MHGGNHSMVVIHRVWASLQEGPDSWGFHTILSYRKEWKLRNGLGYKLGGHKFTGGMKEGTHTWTRTVLQGRYNLLGTSPQNYRWQVCLAKMPRKWRLLSSFLTVTSAWMIRMLTIAFLLGRELHGVERSHPALGERKNIKIEWWGEREGSQQ